jgi:hypothetical protein
MAPEVFRSSVTTGDELRLSASVEGLLKDVPGTTTAFEIVDRLLETHPLYGEGRAASVRVGPPPTDALRDTAEGWLQRVRAVFNAEQEPLIDGRMVVVGLGTLDAQLHDRLKRDRFLEAVEREIGDVDEKRSATVSAGKSASGEESRPAPITGREIVARASGAALTGAVAGTTADQLGLSPGAAAIVGGATAGVKMAADIAEVAGLRRPLRVRRSPSEDELAFRDGLRKCLLDLRQAIVAPQVQSGAWSEDGLLKRIDELLSQYMEEADSIKDGALKAALRRVKQDLDRVRVFAQWPLEPPRSAELVQLIDRAVETTTFRAPAATVSEEPSRLARIFRR